MALRPGRNSKNAPFESVTDNLAASRSKSPVWSGRASIDAICRGELW